MQYDEHKLVEYFADAPAGVGFSDLDLNNIPHHISCIMDGNGRWATARGLARILRLPRPEPKRARGRPAKNPEQPEGNEGPEAGEYAATGRAALYAAGAAVMLLAFAATLAERMLSVPAFFDSPLAAGLIMALGSALGVAFCGSGRAADNGARGSIRVAASAAPSGPAGPPGDTEGAGSASGLFARIPHAPPATAICLALGLCGLALALPKPFTSPLAVAVLNAGEGFVGAAAACALAGPFSLPPLRRSNRLIPFVISSSTLFFTARSRTFATLTWTEGSRADPVMVTGSVTRPSSCV